MSPKRRVGGRTRSQSSLINRLTQRRPPLGRSGRSATRDRGHARPIRIQRGSFAVYFRPAVAGLFVIALALGIATSHPVVERILGGEHSAVRVLVRSVAVLGNVRLAVADVAKASGVAPDSLASEVNAEQVARTLEQHPWIQRAEAILLPTGVLLVGVEEREPVALVRDASDSDSQTIWHLVDPNGTPFARTRAEDWSRLPRFRSPHSLATGEIEPAMVEALSIERFIRDRGGNPLAEREIELPAQATGRGWVLHSQTLPRTVILGEDDLAARLGRLALLLASDHPSARGAEEIDLRFADHAVLRSRSSSR